MPLPKTQQATLDALAQRLEDAQERMIGFPVGRYRQRAGETASSKVIIFVY